MTNVEPEKWFCVYFIILLNNYIYKPKSTAINTRIWKKRKEIKLRLTGVEESGTERY